MGITITSITKKALWEGGGGGHAEKHSIYDPQSKSNPQSSWQHMHRERCLIRWKDKINQEKQISISTPTERASCNVNVPCSDWYPTMNNAKEQSKVITSLITLLCFFSNAAELTATETQANDIMAVDWWPTPRLQILVSVGEQLSICTNPVYILLSGIRSDWSVTLRLGKWLLLTAPHE